MENELFHLIILEVTPTTHNNSLPEYFYSFSQIVSAWRRGKWWEGWWKEKQC